MRLRFWKFVYRVAILLVMAAVPIGCFQPDSKDQSSGAYLEGKVDVQGIPQFSRISAELYRGGQPTKDGWDYLKTIGIKTVLCLRTNPNNCNHVQRLAMQYQHIPFKHLRPEDDTVLRFLQIVIDPNQQPVFVHCYHGVDRVGMMSAVYRIVVQGWSKDRALKEMEEFGHWGLWDPLEIYIRKMDVEEIQSHLSVTRKL
jgi:protein tyrosine phosphatase (PTP) superfamily phosphohydrolase (DUF442 family)